MSNFKESLKLDNLNVRDLKLEDFYNRLQELDNRRLDIVTPSKKLTMRDGEIIIPDFNSYGADFSAMGIDMDNSTYIKPNDLMVSQMCSKLSIPIRFAKNVLMPKMGFDEPVINRLWDNTVNGLLAYDGKQKRKARNFLIRSWEDDNGGNIGRCFLSDSYLAMTNFDLVQWATKAIQEAGIASGTKVDLESCSVTGNKIYMRFMMPSICRKIKGLRKYKNPKTFTESDGNIVAGFVVSNSEVGQGKLSIAPCIFVDACSNELVWTKEAFEKTHLGTKLPTGIISWSQETRRHNYRTILSQVRDVVRKFMSPDFLGEKAAIVQASIDTPLENPMQCVTNVCENLGISENDTKSVFNYFSKQGSQDSHFDVLQAVTFFARENVNEDTRYELGKKTTGLLNKMQQFDKLVEAK